MSSSSFLVTAVLFSSSSNFEVGVCRKKNVESVLLQRARLIVTRWCLWFDELLDIQGEILRWTGMRYFFDLLLSSEPRDKKQHCHLRFADVLLLKKDSEESIASIFTKKKWYFRHEWISSQDVFESMPYSHCKNWSCEDNEADAKSFFRVEIFFLQSEGHRTHCWKNGCSRDQRKLNFSCPEVVKSEFDLQNLGCESCLRCGSSSSKAGLYFVEGWRLRRQTLQAGHFFEESS